MARLNKLSIIGHLGADPELRYTPAGKAVANMRVAVNNGTKQPDGSWSDDTLWVGVSAWEEAGERAADQLRKGNLVYVEGQLDVRDYTDRDGVARYAVEMKFARIQSLERRDRTEEYQDAPPAREPVAAAAGTAVDVDDIPF
jgi:single-strand DNA-binding protein